MHQAAGGAQLDGEGIGRREPAEGGAVGEQGVGADAGVAAVVLGAGRAVAVAEAVELLGIEVKGGKALLEQGLDHRPVADLEADGDPGRCGAALVPQPLTQLGQAGAAVLEGALAADAAIGGEQADLVLLACPVDEGKPVELACLGWHGIVSSDCAMLNRAAVTCRRSLYWRSIGRWRRDRRGLPTGRRPRPTGGGAGPMLVLAGTGYTRHSPPAGAVGDQSTPSPGSYVAGLLRRPATHRHRVQGPSLVFDIAGARSLPRT